MELAELLAIVEEPDGLRHHEVKDRIKELLVQCRDDTFKKAE